MNLLKQNEIIKMYNINQVELTQKTTIYQVKFNDDVVVYTVSTLKSAQNIIKCFIQYNVIDYATYKSLAHYIRLNLISSTMQSQPNFDNKPKQYLK